MASNTTQLRKQLFEAIVSSDLEQLNVVLPQLKNLNFQFSAEETKSKSDQSAKDLSPLHLAIFLDKKNIVEMLLDHGADMIYAPKRDGGIDMFSPLFLSLKLLKFDIIILFLNKGVDINYTQENKNIIDILFSTSAWRYLDLSSSEIQEKMEKIIDLLKEKGYDFEKSDNGQKTAFYYIVNEFLETTYMASDEKKLERKKIIDYITYKLLSVIDDGFRKYPQMTEKLYVHNVILYDNFEIVDDLLKKGVKVDLEFNNVHLLLHPVKKNNLKMVELLLDKGYPIDKPFIKEDGRSARVLHKAIEMNNSEMVKLLLSKGATIGNYGYVSENAVDSIQLALDHKDAKIFEMLINKSKDTRELNLADPKYLKIAIEKKNLKGMQILLENGSKYNDVIRSNPIWGTSTSVTPLYIALEINFEKGVDLLLEQPDIDLDKSLQLGSYYNSTIIRLAKDGKFMPNLNNKIIKFYETKKNPSPSEMWKGWTQSDASKFDTVFTPENANNYACCPVCLKFVERSEACIYMKHNCQLLEGYCHQDLYDKYKTPEGNIYWCTICGRISLGHRHFKLTDVNSDRPTLLPAGDPFENDCRLTNHGGGLPEKVSRIRRLREFGLEAQKYIGKRTEEAVLNELVEEMWNAPLMKKNVVETIMKNKKWNIPLSAFPPNRPNSKNAPPKPNVMRPAANAANPALQPIVHENGQNAANFYEEKPIVIQFRHRKADGTINTHENEFIGKDTLETFIRESVKSFSSQEFGTCWNYAGGCTALLYPEEIKQFLPEDLYTKYKMHFNNKYYKATGGMRSNYIRTRKIKNKLKKKGKHNTYRGRGGGFGNIFTEASDAKCYLPQSTNKIPIKTRKGGRRRNNTKK